jgi:hypothetical protein
MTRVTTRPLDVLVIESERGAADAAVRALEVAGHHTVSCYLEDDGAGPLCRAVADPADCPLLLHPDVALLVRRRVARRPGGLEQGASCALRAGVPLVEAGPAPLDPYEPWLAGRVEGGDGGAVVVACEAASASALDALRRRILRLVGPALAAAGVAGPDVGCRIEPRGPALHVRFDLPAAASAGLRQALAVRVLDAVRGGRQTYAEVTVSVGDSR